jgi:hypothetical protein
VARYITITLEKRGVSCVARLLDEDAPKTCDIVWNALPLRGDVYHAKYASNEIYTLVKPLPGDEPGGENITIVPAAGDVCYFYFPIGEIGYRWARDKGFSDVPAVVDLAIFYGRNNLLLSPTQGFVRANVYATIVENLEAFAAACNDVWRAGAIDETLSYARLEGRN